MSRSKEETQFEDAGGSPKDAVLIISGSPQPGYLPGTAGGKTLKRASRCTARDNVFRFIQENRIHTIILHIDEDKRWEFQLLKLIKTYDPLLDVVVVGPSADSDAAVSWISQGADHYLNEPLSDDALREALARIKGRRTLRHETDRLEEMTRSRYIFHGIVGKNPRMLEVLSLAETIAVHFSTVLITGETGTGKELLARAIHASSPVSARKFVVCDCASIPESLFESELFGCVKGAFTGADRNRRGLVEEADGGVIFLDEIEDVPLSVQAKLLRVIETRRFRPLGSAIDHAANVRVIAATNRSLRDEVGHKAFREDLFHRLNKIEIGLPPLRSRPDDIPLLVRYFLDKSSEQIGSTVKGVNRQVMKLFLRHLWPGNVRELKNVIERALLVCRREFIDFMDLPENLQNEMDAGAGILPLDRERYMTLRNLEAEYISYLMGANTGNILKTAKILGISRSTLYRKLSALGIRDHLVPGHTPASGGLA
jgi:DNA-binding NtrC family response regulator